RFSKRYYGPYLILERIGKVAYKLALPSHLKIHNVFHGSLLKPYEGPPPSTVDQLPPFSVDHHPLVTPLAIIRSQDRIINGQKVRYVLVQWQGLPPEDTTWEAWDELCADYNLEDKVGLEGGSIDMNQGGDNSKDSEEDTRPNCLDRP
ncbi:hypothetical protein L195_g031078, partial [Trifolium pratense]